MRRSAHDTLVQRLAMMLVKLNQGEDLEPRRLAEDFGVNLRTIQRDLNERFGYLPVEKVGYDAFYATRLEWILRKVGIRRLIVSGIVTNGGVSSTVRGAHVREFQVTVLEDGCVAFTQELHDTAIAALRPVAEISTVARELAKLA
jgi:nicotinamidase-related amidase